MKFDLKCKLIFSRKISENDFDKVSEAIERAREVLDKGVPKGKEGCRIAEKKITREGVYLNLISSRYARAHDVVFRIINKISPLLGRELKLGIRDVKVISYEIEYELEKEPENSKNIALPFVEKLEIKDGKAYLKLRDIDREALENKYVDRLLKRLDEKIKLQEAKGKAEFSKIIRQSEPRIEKYKIKEDPTRILEENNFVMHAGRGVWIILPPYFAIWRAIECLVYERIARKLGFVEAAFPKIITLDIERKKGQLYGIPNEMLYVCAPKTRDAKAWEDYIDLVKITGKEHADKLFNKLSEPEFALSYAQCEPFYEIWSGKIIDGDKLPIKLFDSYGPTWRHESGGLKGLERLTEFKRIEFTWLGFPEQVIEIRDKIRDEALKIIDKIFDVEWKLEATTAVYLEHAGEIEKENKEKKDYVKTYDLSITLPFETPSRKEKNVEIASFHVHEDFYARNFNWKERKNRKLWSGCAGISPTRWAYVFILRYGLDYDNYPKEIKRYIGKNLPKLPKIFL